MMIDRNANRIGIVIESSSEIGFETAIVYLDILMKFID
jgi:hypothetical protein